MKTKHLKCREEQGGTQNTRQDITHTDLAHLPQQQLSLGGGRQLKTDTSFSRAHNNIMYLRGCSAAVPSLCSTLLCNRAPCSSATACSMSLTWLRS